MRDRYVGSLMGLACGDALGAPVEFKHADDVRRTHGVLRDMVAGGPWAAGEWTDDTAMALAVAEGIAVEPGDPVAEIGKRFLAWRDSGPKDVGSTISAALRAFNGCWPDAGRAAAGAVGRAAGNGSLMRTAGVALAYPDVPTMLRQSARISAMTHWDPQAEACCAVYCLWLRGILRGVTAADSWVAALERCRSTPAQPTSETPGTVGVPDEVWDRLAAAPDKSMEDLQPTGYAGYTVECLEAAVWASLQCFDIEEALVTLVNLGGETDTMAAVAGAAAGAMWGVGAIPDRWLNTLHQANRIERAAIALEAVRHGSVYDRVPPFSYDRITDRILAGRNPLTSFDVVELASEGITHILDLRQPDEWNDDTRFGAEAIDTMHCRGIAHLSVPLHDLSVPDPPGPTPQELNRIWAYGSAFVHDDPESECKLYIHCRAGIERSATALMALLGRGRGLSVDGALAVAREGRPGLLPIASHRQAVEAWLDT